MADPRTRTSRDIKELQEAICALLDKVSHHCQEDVERHNRSQTIRRSSAQPQPIHQPEREARQTGDA
jgi:hypothetical protein